MIEATNIFAEPAVNGRIDIGSAARSAETAMFLSTVERSRAARGVRSYKYSEEWMMVVEGEVTVGTARRRACR